MLGGSVSFRAPGQTPSLPKPWFDTNATPPWFQPPTAQSYTTVPNAGLTPPSLMAPSLGPSVGVNPGGRAPQVVGRQASLPSLPLVAVHATSQCRSGVSSLCSTARPVPALEPLTTPCTARPVAYQRVRSESCRRGGSVHVPGSEYCREGGYPPYAQVHAKVVSQCSRGVSPDLKPRSGSVDHNMWRSGSYSPPVALQPNQMVLQPHGKVLGKVASCPPAYPSTGPHAQAQQHRALSNSPPLHRRGMDDATPRNQGLPARPDFTGCSAHLLPGCRESRETVASRMEPIANLPPCAAAVPRVRSPSRDDGERNDRNSPKAATQGLRLARPDLDRSMDFSEGRNTRLPPLSVSSDSGRDGRMTKPPPLASKQLEASFDSSKDGASTPTTAAAAAVAAAELEKTKRELARASYELDVIKVDKSKLEQEVFTLKDQLLEQDVRIGSLQQELAAQREIKVIGFQKDQEQLLRSEICSLEQRLEDMRAQKQKCEEEKHNLWRESTMSEDRIVKLEDELHVEKEKANTAEGARNNWYKMYFQQNRDNHSLQRAVEEQRTTIWDLEVALKQERVAAQIASPGDYFKLMKASEPMNLQQQNVELKRELENMRQTLDNALYQMAPSEPDTMSSMRIPGTTRSMLGKDEQLSSRW